MLNLTPYILLFPLIGFIVLGMIGRSMPKAAISLIGCGVVLIAFGLACADFISMLGQAAANRSNDSIVFQWVASGTLTINFGVLLDPLSAIMLLIITGVGFLIHVYSIGYMSDDEGYWRFFSFLNLFVFAMALLVAADNFLFLLVGWAGVGLASFLLIGFWYMRPSAVAAARKAFVVNVIGDFGLMLAIFLLFKFFGTLNYSSVFLRISQRFVAPSPLLPPSTITNDVLTAIALLLFVAAAAKSAQLPLHVWLPDAMEGPTPVSALIHAATMVTAGVYLVARAAPIFTAVPNTLIVVGIVAGASSLFAATIACVQTDIKRVLAYSTMSQLGYMFMGEAAGGFSSGIFHLLTHAFFKALLFMCAGAVIHALGGEQDMRKMGGLLARLPYTFWMFLFAGLALAAIVPFAGFWSKDAILGSMLAMAQHNSNPVWWILYGVGILTAALTGFYTFRLIFTVFLGAYRGEAVAAHGNHSTRGASANSQRDPLAQVHEPGPAMLIPMAILTLLSIIGGFVGIPEHSAIGDFLSPVLGTSPELSGGAFWLSLGLSLAAALLGIGIAWTMYGARQHTFAPARGFLKLLERRYYIDDLYNVVIVAPVVAVGEVLRNFAEDAAFDGGSRGIARTIGATSRGLRRLQTGYVRNYALAIFVGAALILLFYVIHP